MTHGIGQQPYFADTRLSPAQAAALPEAGRYRRQAGAVAGQSATGEPLTEGERKQVEKLKQRDREVRTHEQAHVAAGGSIVTSGPHYEFQEGPDGKQYAIGGEVQIDTSRESSPEENLEKAQLIRTAALAPSDPSPQDLKVAAQAAQMEIEAQQELSAQEKAQSNGETISDIRALSAREADHTGYRLLVNVYSQAMTDGEPQWIAYA